MLIEMPQESERIALTGARRSSVPLWARSSDPDPGSPHATRSSCTCAGIRSPTQRTSAAQGPEPKPGRARRASPARSDAWYPTANYFRTRLIEYPRGARRRRFVGVRIPKRVKKGRSPMWWYLKKRRRRRRRRREKNE